MACIVLMRQEYDFAKSFDGQTIQNDDRARRDALKIVRIYSSHNNTSRSIVNTFFLQAYSVCPKVETPSYQPSSQTLKAIERETARRVKSFIGCRNPLVCHHDQVNTRKKIRKPVHPPDLSIIEHIWDKQSSIVALNPPQNCCFRTVPN